MSGARQSQAANCGCCTGVQRATPQVIANRPSLPAISYRVGAYPTFFTSMMAALSDSSFPLVAKLSTRSNSDFSIALIDAWSEALDILTFYTERLANEAYLGPAIEPRSVFELSRLVGFKPSPGVSASTIVAYSVATAPGSPTTVTIPSGSRVQSVPGPGQTPAVFETSTDLTATIANNAIPAATTIPWQLFGNDLSTWIAGTSNNINVGDALLFVKPPGLNASNPPPSDEPNGAVVYVTAVKTDPTGGNTMISWDQPLPFASGETVSLYVMRQKAALYGVNAPVPGMFAGSTLGSIPPYSGSAPSPPGDWPWRYAGGSVINLDNAYPGLQPSATQSQWLILTGPSDSKSYSQYTSYFQVQSATEANPGLYGLSAKTTRLTIANGDVLSGATWLDLDTLLSLFVQETRTTTAYVGSQLLSVADLPVTKWPLSKTYKLASGMLAPVSGASVSLAGVQPVGANSPIAFSGKRVRIVPLAALNGSNGGFTPTGAVRALPISANQAFLVDAFPPQPDPTIVGNLLWSVLTTAGQGTTSGAAPAGQPSTPTGQPGILSTPGSSGSFQLLPSQLNDSVAAEAALVSSSLVNGATTTLTLSSALQRIYDAATVRANANAVAATHGETVMEILGSGNATNAALQLQLKQSPLTYVAAATNGGAQSTLEVRVNNLLWREVQNFLSSQPANRAYVTTPAVAAGPMVQFGDGAHGSRTPTGVNNIQARYRKGIGLAGMVAPGQLTIPLDRPQGVQTVANPSAASGGADPTSAASTKVSAPLPTLTLSRIVTLEDYRNYALNFAGVALALATWTWFGAERGIFLTLAGVGGTPLDASDATVVYLMQAYQNYGLPNVRVLPVSYSPQNFELAMRVKVDTPTYLMDQVIAQVWGNLVAAFAFGRRAPGQGVAASEVIEIAQNTPGVVAVNLIAFNLSGAGASVQTRLCASGPIPASASGTPARGAQVLRLDPASQGNVTAWT